MLLTPQDANGFRRVLGTVDGAAGHQDIGAGFHDERGRLGVHAAVYLQAAVGIELLDILA